MSQILGFGSNSGRITATQSSSPRYHFVLKPASMSLSPPSSHAVVQTVAKLIGTTIASETQHFSPGPSARISSQPSWSSSSAVPRFLSPSSASVVSRRWLSSAFVTFTRGLIGSCHRSSSSSPLRGRRRRRRRHFCCRIVSHLLLSPS